MGKEKPTSTMTKFVAVVVSLLAVSAVNAGPGKPQISVGLNTDLLDKGLLNALEPTIQWETSEVFPNGAEIEVRTIYMYNQRKRANEKRTQYSNEYVIHSLIYREVSSLKCKMTAICLAVFGEG
jgi:hypothetical protein